MAKSVHALIGVSLGSCVAISSALVYSLEKGEDGLKMTLEEASWIRQLKMYKSFMGFQFLNRDFCSATLFLLGATVGSMAGGLISTFVGRRLTLLLFGLPVCFSAEVLILQP